MAVYVDDAENSYGRMVMCHMWADTLDELLDMARRIGVDAKWIQGHPSLSTSKKAREASWVHFDICKSRRANAIELGAVQTDRFGPIEHVARLHINSGVPIRVAHGHQMLESALAARARRAK
jgi:hypothetical protein